MRYLGHKLTLCSGEITRCDFHSSKIKFVAATNGILGKIGSNSRLNVIIVTLSILVSTCVPILIFGLHALTINNMDLAHLSIIVEIFVSSTRVLPRPLPMAQLRCGVRDGGVYLSEF